MSEAWPYLISGVVVGLAGGFAPGPLTTLVVVQTLRYGVAEGLKIAVAPLVTDAPIVLATLVAFRYAADIEALLGGITVVGAGVLGYLAYESLTATPTEEGEPAPRPHSFKKGVIANLCNPHPYLFWLSVGAPTVYQAYRVGPLLPVVFVLGLYACLIGAKIFIAVMVGRSRVFLRSRGYRWALRALGGGLLVLALTFLLEGLRLLGAR